MSSPVSSRLATELCGIALRNPVLAASGTFAYGIEFAPVVNLEEIGGIVVKGLSRGPMDGNPAPRIYEAEGGMMNSVGLQNIGVRAFVDEKLPALRLYSTPILANVFGHEIDDYLEVVRVLNDAEGLAAYELNVSCPNTKCGGIIFCADSGLLARLVSAVSRIAARPVIVKLSPNVASVPAVAKVAEDAGAQALSLVNTFIALAIDPRTRKPRLGAGYGGLSGPAIKPISLRMVHEAWCTVKIPVIGLGGIASGTDAAEFMIAGASAVQVGTATFWDPRSPVRIARELDAFLQDERIQSVRSLTGTLDWGKKET